MDNPNEYSDEEFTRYSIGTNDAIGGLWEAGASPEDIEDVIENALDNAAGTQFSVTITPA